MKKFLVLVFAGSLALGFLGCAAMEKKNKGLGGQALLEPQAALKFSDVPVPIRFKLLPKESYSFESAGVRVGVLKYQGKANPDQVANFYKEQMPMYNWNLLNIVEYGNYMLNFDREAETCVVSLLPKGSNVTIIISVGPKAQAPKKAAKPIK